MHKQQLKRLKEIQESVRIWLVDSGRDSRKRADLAGGLGVEDGDAKGVERNADGT